MIPREYSPHGHPIKYYKSKGSKKKWIYINLGPKAEEAACLYALLPKHHTNSKDIESCNRFNDNFFSSWKSSFETDDERQIESLHNCDFVAFKVHAKAHDMKLYNGDENKFKYVQVTYVDSNGVKHENERCTLTKYKVAATSISTHKGDEYGLIRWSVCNNKAITLNVNNPDDTSDYGFDSMNQNCKMIRDDESNWIAKWKSWSDGRNYYAKFRRQFA